MSLKLLPDLQFPVTLQQANVLMENVVQLNIIDGALSERTQRALGLYLHTFDLWVKSGGKVDYRGKDGHRRLIEDAMRFVGTGNPVATRHGDLAAAHLAIDWSDTQVRLAPLGQALSANVSELIGACPDLAEFSPEMEKRTGLLMDYWGKKSVS